MGFNRKKEEKSGKKKEKKRRLEGIAGARDGRRRECRTRWTVGKRGESDEYARDGQIYLSE